MTHWVRQACALFAAAILAVSATLAVAQSSVDLGTLDRKSAFADEIRAAAAGGAPVRVVVQLRLPERAAALGTSQQDMSVRRAIMREWVDDVLAPFFPSMSIVGAPFAPSISLTPQMEQQIGLVRVGVHPIFALNASLEMIEQLASHPEVINIHPDFELELQLEQSIPQIGIPVVHDSYGGSGIGRAVAILDTGVDHGHPWFAGRLIGEGCFSGGGTSARSLCADGSSESTDPGSGAHCVGYSDCHHGTHVAGIAVGWDPDDPAQGSYAVARDAFYVSFQIATAPRTSGGSLSVFTVDLLNALSHLYERHNSFGVPVDAVNISAGIGLFAGNCVKNSTDSGIAYSTVYEVIEDLRNVGIVTVAAAGNHQARDAMIMPACLANVVSVANVQKDNVPYNGTNVSALTRLYAPGSSIRAPMPGNKYGLMTGTSMSAPHVAGAFAAIRSVCPNIPHDSAGIDYVMSVLEATGLPIDDDRPGGVHHGIPLIQVDLALASIHRECVGMAAR